MTRRFRIVVITGCVFLGTLFAFALIISFLLYTAPGRGLVEPIVGWASGGSVAVKGLSGDLPDSLRAETVEISDAQGIWLKLENVSLDWDAIAAIRDHIAIHSVSASKITVLRRPIEEKSSGTTLQIDIDALNAPDIEIAAAVAGRKTMLRASGSLHYLSRHRMRGDIAVAQIDGAGRYRINGGVANDVATGAIAISEDVGGILSSVLGMPGMGPISLSANAWNIDSKNSVAFTLSAGALRAKGGGTITLARREANVAIHAAAGEMQPNSDLSWQSLAFDGQMNGSFDAPHLNGRFSVLDAAVSGARMTAVEARVTGTRGSVELSGTIKGLRLPGGHPDLFAEAPVEIEARAELRAANRPITFKISHPLLAVSGRADTGDHVKLAADLTLPSLQPFARIQNEDLHGAATIKLDVAQESDRLQFTVTGRVDAQGASLVARVLGRNASFAAHATTSGTDIIHSDAAIVGKALDFRAGGALRAKRIQYDISVKLPDVSLLSATLVGNAALTGRIVGPIDTAETAVFGTAMIASHGFDPHRIDLTAQGKGFPRFSSGKLRIVGNLNGAPVNADAALVHNGKLTMNGAVEWKSLHANGNFEFPVRAPATGKATVAVGQLADLSPFLVTGLKGTLTSSITLAPRGNVSVAGLHGQISNAEIAGTTIVSATATGTVTDPFGAPSLAFDLSAQKLILAGVTGDAKVKLSGPLRNVAIAADAKLEDLRGAPAHISANAGFNTEKRALVLDRMNAEWRGETAALAFPATVETANGVKIDQAVVRIGTGTVKLSGRITPALSAFVAMTSVDAQILQPFVPTPLRGSLSATAELSGTLSEPRGTFSAHAHSLVAQAYFPKTSMNIDAQGTLHGDGALLDATLSAGAAVRLTLKGDAPLRATAPMRLSVDGVADLTLLDPFLAAEGQRLRGTLAFDGDILGTLSSPRLSGGGTLKNGELQDYTRGIHVRSIDAAFKGEGQSLRITQLSARAGPGTISGNGQIDFSAPGTPLDIVLKIQKARPIVSDLVTAVVSGNVHISGTLERTLAVAGKLDVSRGTINIPDRFPPDVAVLDVRRKNSAEPPQPPGSASVALDLAVATSGPIFVRGRGIDADLGGSLHLGNTLAVPLATGGFDMNRGTVTLAGQTLTFTTGKLGFDGGSVRNSIDPSLNFVAQTTSGGVTATLTVTGHASKPQIVLSSAPSLPQDEVLAHLFFQQSAKQLTPLQLAQIAQAIASLGGVGSGFDPLGALRRNLRLDRLSIGSTSGGASGGEAQTTVEGGKYVARNVYVGAKQTLSGSTQVQVQVDLTKQLKAQATVSTGTNATSVTGNSAQNAGSSVGLSYEFEY